VTQLALGLEASPVVETAKLPPIGTRFVHEQKRVKQPMRGGPGAWELEKSGAVRVWELIESLPEGRPHQRNPLRTTGERHKLRIVEERGFLPTHSYGVGYEMFVEDAWFTWRTDFRRIAPGKGA
jgi:hypothetical protein